MGRLTTHVLDTALGKPAKGLKIELWRTGSEPSHISTHVTNEDGRVDGPILSGEAFAAGTYELRFKAGAYLRSTGQNLPDPLFLDEIPIRFGIAEAGGHYHVPLLLSPFGYSTYRGS
ncbi:5-hydroxyisourate hydrolase [Roseibium hamelinense]|uniref:5-hydroxyisourate hydrolase n=1 Tax=Roseibium hamelinense TaxID=150831 RepID=A0A562TJ62_9HYPH|nr:hydroxyisourate hydrolase [Roseibium hamelinense]MTI45811.1 hydroxyisourate hydrolase [Roseibium hamelinense]TWI93006.1 5-hydroxyisourate hydrolase [Roseibium hamelinense]